MSSTSVVLESTITKTQQQQQQQTNKNHNNRNTNNASFKRKSKHDRSSRKRSKSFSGLSKMLNLKPVLPTKFLLGGNINDPLNLNSLQDEEINRAMNAVTPKSSPIPTPPRRKGQIEVIIPPNINDPLNLIDCADDAEYEQQLCSPVKKGRKKRIKKRRTVSATVESLSDVDNNVVNSEAKTPEIQIDSAKIPDVPKCSIINLNNKTQTSVDSSNMDCNIVISSSSSGSSSNIVGSSNNNKELNFELLSPTKKDKTNKRKSDEFIINTKKFKYSMDDKIVSPVVPQPGAWLKRSTSVLKRQKPRHNKSTIEVMPQFKEKNKQFQYGNYNRYYGYRNANNEVDHRLKVFSHHPNLFEEKDILDIGCNIGHITLSIARDFRAKTVTGIDIDPRLIAIARKNVKHYVKSNDFLTNEQLINHSNLMLNKKCSEFFPISMPIIYGSIDIPGYNDFQNGRDFPDNVIFKQCNYILADDTLISLEQPQFDVILCLSITKWIHLNWGDAGIKQAFRRMYAQLKAGGKLILEPQNWASYKSKRKLTEIIYKNYNTIEFFPEKFTEYLLSSVVGFAKSEILGYPNHDSKGFRRAVQVFTKSTMFPSERYEATPNDVTPNSTVSNTVKSESQTPQQQQQQNHQQQQTVDKSEHVYYTNMLNSYCVGSTSNDNRFNVDDVNSVSMKNVINASNLNNCSNTDGKLVKEDESLKNISGDNT